MASRMMKGIDDFFYVLGIALALIIVFTAVSMVWPYAPGPGTPGGESNITVAELSVGTVGFSENEPRSSSLGTFTVGETQSESLKRIPQLEISAGMFGSQSEKLNVEIPSYYMDSLRDIMVTFRVYDTNEYGNLYVKWNGKDFHAMKTPRGDVEVKIDANYVEASNTLEVYCDGPGLAFWAATVYTLRDFRVDLEYGPSKVIAFTLDQAETEAFSRGELKFIGYGNSNLRVRVNGYKVWDQMPDGVETVVFNYTGAPLKLGSNILSIDAPTGQVTLNNAMLNIYVLTNQVTRTRNFDITDSQYTMLDGQGYTGVLRFRVEDTTRQGELRAELNGNVIGSVSPRNGWNAMTFSASEANEGSNTLEFSGTGYWTISDAEVILSK
ncbi:MAG: hypothetical protein DRO99_02665 [Candidatus Aenigmatarchaeota archaeon]|nr:MAG: hypothetical protein DRO99_02665 [Candidatus Aenigmarchaeota archaeon]